MPWCETCSRFLNPNTLDADGSCPTCGRVVAEPAGGGGRDGGRGTRKAPWHFKVLLVLVVLYLGWRFLQMGGWLLDWLTG